MELLITLCFGLIIGALGTWIVIRIRVSGVLRIDTSDPYDQPYLFLELTKEISTVRKKKYVIFKVSTKNYISQK